MTLNQAKARHQLDRDPGTPRFGPVTRQDHHYHVHMTMPDGTHTTTLHPMNAVDIPYPRRFARAAALRSAATAIRTELGSEEGFMPCCTVLGDHATHSCDYTAGLSIPDWLDDRAASLERGDRIERGESA